MLTAYDELNHAFEHAAPEQILRWAHEEFDQSLALVTSLQITGIATLHMLQRLGIHLPILTLDTGLLFDESYTLIEQVEQFFDVEIQRITPRQTVSQQQMSYGPRLWERQPDRCCHYRKVLPFREAAAPYAAWITGLRRDQGATRAHTPIIGSDGQSQKVKLSPFARWSEQDVWEYIHAYDLPYNRLHTAAYPSIGCQPCTHPVLPDSNDKRAGRWRNSQKVECGLHGLGSGMV